MMRHTTGDDTVDTDRLHQVGASIVAFDASRRTTTLPVLHGIEAESEDRERIRLLIVEDDEDDLAMLQQMLVRSPACNFEMERATSVETALRRIASEKFDACLIDYRLPGRHGLDLVRLAHRRGFSLPMILMSGFADEETDAEAMELGAADFLDKEELDTGRLERCIRFAITRHRAAQRLDQLAQYDVLTGLANRALFHDRLDRALAAARRHQTMVAVMVLDLNNFKPINDDLGHAAGDHVLRSLSDRLTDRLRETDTVARLGGDEFAIIIENLRQPEHAALVAGKILEVLTLPVDVERLRAKVSGALGVALYPADNEDAVTLLQYADAAMYRAKAEGGNRCRFHDRSLEHHADCQVVLHNELKAALERDALELRFLPQLSLRGPTLALSALPQWQHSEHGLISTDRLQSLAEDAGITENLTRWMVEAAVANLREWHHLGIAKLHVAVPILSHRQLAWSGLADHAASCLRRHNLSQQALEFEIDENLFLHELDNRNASLASLHEAGLRLALSAYGEGVASLTALRDAPVNTLKLGSGLLRNVPEDPHRSLFVEAVVQLARHLKLRIVVDVAGGGVRVRSLKHTGCDAVQGLPCPTPLVRDVCTDWLRAARLRWQPHAFQDVAARPRL